MDWFRLHHGMPQDPKWIVVARRAGVPVGAVLAVWVSMLDAASRASVRGNLEGWDDEDVAAMLGYETEQVAAIYDAMQGKTLDGDRIAAWDKRQPKRERDDDSAARVRAHRDRNASAGHVTPCNASGDPETPRGEERREEEDIDDGGDERAPDPGDPPPSRIPFDPATQRVIEAAGADPSKQAGWMTAGIHVAKWLQRGLDLDLDVVPAIRAVMVQRRGQGPPNGPAYFDRAVIEAHERRLQPLPDVTIPTTGGRTDGRTSRPNDYDAAASRNAFDAGLAAAALRRMEAGRR